MFSQFLQHSQARIELALDHWLQADPSAPSELHQAMRYSACEGGKRVRALLVFAAAEAVSDVDRDLLDAVASAVECLHAYSLIHDDLPAMDDDELRRGRPSCHIAFGEATAILAGDALQAKAFEILTHCELDLKDHQRVELVRALALASGDRGMVLGQSIDLNAVAQTLDQAQLEQMHRLKTGALIAAAVRMGAITAGASSSQIQALEEYAQCVGLAFQVQDDVLDVTADTETLGKPQGADAEAAKPTFVSLLGLAQARKYAQQLHEQALRHLQVFDYRADNLRHISGFVVNRKH